MAFHLASNLGWLYVSPVASAFYSRSSPPSLTATLMGINTLAVFLGSVVSGRLGGLIGPRQVGDLMGDRPALGRRRSGPFLRGQWRYQRVETRRLRAEVANQVADEDGGHCLIRPV